MTEAIHPLIAALESVPSLENAEPNQVASVIAAAKQGGVTLTERYLLENVKEAFGDGWSVPTQNRWQLEMAQIPNGLEIVRPNAPNSVAAEDFSSKAKRVYMSGYGQEIDRALVADMILLGKELGFTILLQISPTTSIQEVAEDLQNRTGLSLSKVRSLVDVVRASQYASVWGEDNKMLTNADDTNVRVKILVPPDIEDICFNEAIAYTADEGYHPFFQGSFHGAVDARNEAQLAVDLAQSVSREAIILDTYLEGGNVTPGTSSDSKPYALVGRDSLVVSAFQLSRNGAFQDNQVESKWLEMLSTGIVTDADVDVAAQKMLRVVQMTSQVPPQAVTPEIKERARRFLAELELTKQLIADNIGLPVERTVFVTQPDFHIDMYMRPAHPGEVMVNHPAMCMALIDEALKDPTATEWQKAELQQMKQSAQIELQYLGPMYDQLMTELGNAGLIVIPTPGVFYGKDRLANFMNAQPGTTDQGETYWITIGSSITPLQNAFEQFMNDNIGVDRIAFIGNAGGSATELTAGEQSLLLSGSNDCREVHHAGGNLPMLDLLNQYAMRQPTITRTTPPPKEPISYPTILPHYQK